MMQEIIFVGNPNAGKSTLFNALARAHAHTGNWHGVTVGAFSKIVKSKKEEFIYTDLPGVYSLNGYSMEEKKAVDYLKNHSSAFIVNVIDVRYLSRSLRLTKALLNGGTKLVVALTMCQSFYKNGGRVDIKILSKRLGIPVYVVNAFDKKSVSDFNGIIQSNQWKTSFIKPVLENIMDNVYVPQNRKDSLVEKICYNHILCLPIFFLLITFLFFLTFGKGMPGSLCKEWLENLICERLSFFVAQFLPTPAVRALVCDGFLRSAGGVLSFLPQITLLYAFLLFLEESGYMSALAFTADGVFRKFGLNGRAVFCILLGFGCTAQATLSTRGFERKEMQHRTIFALSYISCSAKLPVYLTLLSAFFSRPFIAVLMLYALGVVVSLAVFTFQKKDTDGDFILELPQMQFPNAIFYLKTLLFRLKQFIIKIATVVTAFTLVVWFASSFNFNFQYVEKEDSMLAFFCGGLKYIFYPIGVYDWQTAFALFSGFVAKENVAGLLTMFYPQGIVYSAHTAAALASFILFSSPCISAIAASAKEIGWGASLFNAIVQTVTAVFASYVVYYVLEIRALIIGVVLLLLICYLLKRFCFERIHSPKRGHLKKFHR